MMRYLASKLLLSISVLLISTTTNTIVVSAYTTTREGSFDAVAPCGYHNTDDDYVVAYLSCDYEFELDRDDGDFDFEEMECEVGFCTEDDCYELDDFEPNVGGVGRSQVNGGPIIFSLYFNFEYAAKSPDDYVMTRATIEFEEDIDWPWITFSTEIDFDCTRGDPPTSSPSATPTDYPTASPSLSPAPTESPQPSPSPTICGDLEDWKDNFKDGCDWYEANDSLGCPKNGHKWKPKSGDFEGIVANEACCYCKGIVV